RSPLFRGLFRRILLHLGLGPAPAACLDRRGLAGLARCSGCRCFACRCFACRCFGCRCFGCRCFGSRRFGRCRRARLGGRCTLRAALLAEHLAQAGVGLFLAAAFAVAALVEVATAAPGQDSFAVAAIETVTQPALPGFRLAAQATGVGRLAVRPRLAIGTLLAVRPVLALAPFVLAPFVGAPIAPALVATLVAAPL